MLKKVIPEVMFVILLLFIGCTDGEKVECITSLDCGEGFLCLEGLCVEDLSQTDEDADDAAMVLPDNGSEMSDDFDQSDELDQSDDSDDFDQSDTSEMSDNLDLDILDEDADSVDSDEDTNDDDTPLPVCGDTVVDNPDELCDGNSIVCSEIGGAGFVNEDEALCNSSCDGWVVDICVCGSGFEKNGEQVCVDINECTAPSHDCDINATCANTEGSFVCECNENFTGTGKECTADTRTGQSCTGLPAHASWNTASAISQTWNGSDWLPSTSGTYDEAQSTTECRYKCSTNYNWDGDSCEAATKTATCPAKPAGGTVWNDGGKNGTYTQTWNGSAFLPDLSTYHSTAAGDCAYKCADDYHWDGSSCIWNTRYDQSCSAKPANTVYNTASSITQTWNGTQWLPTTTSIYNETPGITNCYYKCADGYHREGNNCISNTRTGQSCTGIPPNAQWNTATSITQYWDGSDWTPSTVGVYNAETSLTECRFKCKEHYSRSGGSCVADTQTATCSPKPANTEWNDSGKNGTYTQTWGGSDWTPVLSTTYNTTAGDCRYVCSGGFHREGGTCISNSRTASCTGLPSHAQWNTVSSIAQTWSGSWTPSTTGTYNTSGSTTECRYVCSGGYHWEGGACISNTRTASCTGLPSHAQWNTVSSITQTWSGSWSPSAAGTYNTSGSTSECRYQCSSDFYWSGSSCVECTANTHCSDEAGRPYCYTPTNTCAQCLSDGNCPANYVCNTGRQCVPAPYCGDGHKDPGEECDDGDSDNSDGCKNDCTLGTCQYRIYVEAGRDYPGELDVRAYDYNSASYILNTSYHPTWEGSGKNFYFYVTHSHTTKVDFGGSTGDYSSEIFNSDGSRIDYSSYGADDYTFTANCD